MVRPADQEATAAESREERCTPPLRAPWGSPAAAGGRGELSRGKAWVRQASRLRAGWSRILERALGAGLSLLVWYPG